MQGNNKGYTLIEVIAVTAIIGFVLAGIIAFHVFVQKSFAAGSSRVAMHNNLRLASERITREARLATSLALLESWSDLPGGPAEIEPGVYYLYFDEQRRTLVLLAHDNEIAITEDILTAVSFWLEGDILYYSLAARSRRYFEQVESSVLLLNTVANPTVNPIPAMRFTRP